MSYSLFPVLWQWPPAPGLLDDFLPVYLRDRATWTINEWSAYARFLETRGASFADEITRLQYQLWAERFKHSRRKANPVAAPFRGLLSPRPRRGPKPEGKRFRIAEEVLAVQQELRAAGKRATDKVALGEWFMRQGKGRYRANENRYIINAMSLLRRRHNIRAR